MLLVFVAISVAAAVPQAAHPPTCAGAGCQDGEGVELLQLADAKRQNHTAEADDAFNPMGALTEKVRHCTFGSLCAEQSSHVDFTKLSGFCVLVTHGAYNPLHTHLSEGTCAANGFPCPASSDDVAREVASPKSFESLPAMMKMAAEAAKGQAHAVLRPMEEKALKALRKDIQVFSAKSGYSC